MKRAEKRPWKGAEIGLLAAPLLVIAMWLGWARASKYLLPARAFGHLSFTQDVAFSPDGKYLLSCGGADNGQGGEVALWEWPQGSLKRMLPLPHRVQAIAFSPDGRQIALASRGLGIQVMDGGLERQVLGLPVDGGKVESLAFSPDSRVLAASIMPSSSRDTPEVRLWSTRDGSLLQRANGFSQTASTLLFSPDGQRILALDGSSSEARRPNNIQEFDARTGFRRRIWTHGHARSWGTALAMSPDGKSVAVLSLSGGKFGVAVLDALAQSVRWERTLERSAEYRLGGLAFSPDGKWLACGGSGFEIRDARTGALKKSKQMEGNILSLAWAPDGRTLVSAGKLIERHDMSTLDQP